MDFTYEIVPRLSLTAGVRGTYESFKTNREAYMIGDTPSALGYLTGKAPNFFYAVTPYDEIQKSFGL